MSLIPLKRDRIKGYRLTYNGIGIYEALKQEMYKQTGSPEAWNTFKNSPECNWLPLPPTYGENNASYFTEEGYNKFIDVTMPIVMKYIPSEYIKTEISDIPSNAVVYSDEYQFVIDTDKQEWTHDNHSYDFPNENIYMRPATEDDVDNMYQWEMESIDKSLQEDHKVQSLIRQDCYDSLKDTQMIMDGEHTIGMFTACMIDNGEWRYIGEIYIIPEYRGQGIGSTILKHEVENYDKLRLQVAFDNERALRLYKSLGFKIVRENKEAKLYIMELDKTQQALQEAMSGINASEVDDNFFRNAFYMEDALKAKDRNALENGDFALVYKDKNGKLIRKYPVHDEAHVKAAAKMFPRGVPEKYLKRVASRILREGNHYKLDTSGWKNVRKALEKNVSESYVERNDFIMKEQITKILEAYNSGVLTQEEATEKLSTIQEGETRAIEGLTPDEIKYLEEEYKLNGGCLYKLAEMKKNWDEKYFKEIEAIATDKDYAKHRKSSDQRGYELWYEALKKYRPANLKESYVLDTLREKQDKIMESFKMGIINAKEGMQLIERVMMEADMEAEESDDDDDAEVPETEDDPSADDDADNGDTAVQYLADYINSLSDDDKSQLMSLIGGSTEPTADDANADDATPAEGEPTTEETVDPASVSDASLNDANASLDDMEV